MHAKQNHSLIDHIITNNNNRKFNIGINISDISDHKNIFLTFRDTTNKTKNFVKTENKFLSAKTQYCQF